MKRNGLVSLSEHLGAITLFQSIIIMFPIEIVLCWYPLFSDKPKWIFSMEFIGTQRCYSYSPNDGVVWEAYGNTGTIEAKFVSNAWLIYPLKVFHKWVYPQLDGLYWNIPLKWMI